VTEYLIAFCLAIIGSIWFLLMVAQRAIYELTGLAQVDHLTGALNRLGMTERLDRAQTSPQEGLPAYSVILLDIDRFKDVNDTYGHNAGDAVLTELVTRVSGAIRSKDSLARYGGEEFLVLLPDTDLNEATLIGERLRQVAEERPAFFDGRSIPFTLSVGVAASGHLQRGRTSVIMDADAALYRAKREGRNRVAAARPRSAAASPRGACLTS
jgi:diguanylate cyclase (GGDEF)-like protein